jgi:hypothetical protein
VTVRLIAKYARLVRDVQPRPGVESESGHP